jgi:hypothetical protein
MAVVAVCGLIACGQSGGTKAAQGPSGSSTVVTDAPSNVHVFCASISEWAELQRKLGEDTLDDSQRINDLRKVVALFHDVPNQSPPSIEQAVTTIASIPPNPVHLSDAAKRRIAVKKADAYVAERCDVSFSFADLDFTQPDSSG